MPSRVVVVDKADGIPLAPVDTRPTCVYWNMAGLVQPVRLTLAWSGTDFVDVRIKCAIPSVDSTKSGWFPAKAQLQSIMPFPNLPYYLDQDVTLAQTNAILKHLARKHALMGDAGQEHLVDWVLDEIQDYEMILFDEAYDKGPTAVAEWYLTNVPPMLERICMLLRSKKFVTGREPSIADMKLYAWLIKLRNIHEQLIGDAAAPLLNAAAVDAYLDSVEHLPNLQEYLASADFQSSPICNVYARWRG